MTTVDKKTNLNRKQYSIFRSYLWKKNNKKYHKRLATLLYCKLLCRHRSIFIGILTPRLLFEVCWRPSQLYSVSSYPNDMNADRTNERNKCRTSRTACYCYYFYWQYLKTDNNTLGLFILIHISIVSCSSFIVRCSLFVCCTCIGKYRLIL